MILSANLTWLFPDAPLIERPRLAAEAGFDAVEILAPYEVDARRLREAIESSGLTLDLINSPREDNTGCAAIPGAEALFAQSFETAAAYARDAGCGKLHVLSGKTDATGARDTLTKNLEYAIAQAPDLMLTLEPLCPESLPGYFLNDFHLAAGIVRDLDAPNLRLQYDTFHAAMIHGDARAVRHDLDRPTADFTTGPAMAERDLLAAGDPVAYRVRGALIALRRGQARWIRIDEGVETGADAEEGLGSSEEVA